MGGTVIAKGGSGTASGGGAGIGGGDQCGIGPITINGGTVEATGGSYAAGIGGGDDAEDGVIGTIRITGGNVTATSGEEAAGIGSGNESLAAGDIIISGGTVVATATENYGAGIGGGDSVSGCNVTISGGANVTATGGWHAAGIGSGDGDGDDSLFSGNVTITGAGTVVKATAGAEAAGIGGGNEGKNIGTFIISDGADVTATGGSSTLSVGGAGIGGGEDAEGGTVRISGDATKVTATGGGGSAGIGSGYDSSGGAGDVTIEGGTVLATGGQGGAGIGSGYDAWDNGTVTISGGRVTAIGNGDGTGIGGGQDSEGCDVRISGGTVVATGGSAFSYGIGGNGFEGNGSLVITGGSVLSNAQNSSSIEKEKLGATPYDASGNELHRCLVSLYWPTNDGYAASQIRDDVNLEGLTLQKADGTSIGSYGTNDIFTINSSSHTHDAWPSRNCGTIYLYLPYNDGDSVDLGRVITSDGSTYIKENQTGPGGNGYYYVKTSTTVSFECNSSSQWMPEQVLYYGVPTSLSKSVFTRLGYEFLGWSTTEGATTATWSDEQVVTSLGGEPTIGADATLYAVWKALYPDALISFTSSDTTMGAVEKTLQTMHDGEGYVSRVVATAKTGYHFVNWTVYGTDPAVVAGTDALLTADQIKAQAWDTDHFNTTALVANFAPNEYTVHFDANAAGEVSNVPADQTMRYGEAQDLTSASTMTRAGCKFVGWAKTKDATSAYYADGQSVKNLATGEDGSDSVTLYAVWKINGTATMSYVPDDAGHGSTSPASVTVNRADPERTAAGSKAVAAKGYHFDTSVGWTYVSSNGKTGKASSMPILDVYAIDATARRTGIYESTTYTAHFAGNAYRVEFLEGDTDGTVKGTMDSQSMVYGTPKALTTCAYTRPGYVFLGWRSASGTFYADGAEISTPAAVAGNAAEVWLTAVWQALPDVAITYEVEGGHGTTTPLAEMVGATTPATGSTVTPAAGYHFDYTKGWTYVDGTTTKTACSYLTITTMRVDEVAKASGAYVATTFTAHMAANTYKVFFEGNATDSKGLTDYQSFTYDASANLNANAFTRKGYTFAGWNTASDGSGTPYTDVQEVSNLTSAQYGIVTLYAQWTPISYTVAFNANGGTGTMEPQAMTYGVKRALTTSTMRREGYTFIGWSKKRGATTADYTDAQEVSNLSATADDEVTLYAVWTKLSPALISYSSSDSTMGTCDSKMETVPADAKSGTVKGATATAVAGYHFTNWTVYGTKTEVGTDPKVTAAQIEVVARAHGLYTSCALVANFSPNTYTIKFDASDGTNAPSDQTMAFGTAKNLSSASGMTKPGYTFLGWSHTQGSGKADYADGESVKNLASGEEGNESVTLYAVWAHNSDVVLSYVVDDASHGTCSSVSESVTIGTNAAGSTVTASTGYHFVNWTLLGSTTSLSTDLTYKPTNIQAAATYVAHFAGNAYKVSFDAGEGSGTMADEEGFSYGTGKTLSPNTFTRDGYVFAGWKVGDSARYVADKVSVTDLTTGDATQTTTVTLHAVWMELPEAAVSYVVAPESASGVTHATCEPSGQSIGGTGSVAPTGTTLTPDAGYHFDTTLGWTYVTSEGAKGTVGQTVPSATLSSDETTACCWSTTGYGHYVSAVFTANVTANTYHVSFRSNGGTGAAMADEQMTYDASSALTPNTYARTGYTFDGWSTAADGSGMDYANGDVVSNLTTTDGGEVELFAQWSVNSYAVSFEANVPAAAHSTVSGEMVTQPMAYGASENLNACTYALPGYTFTGWNTAADGSGADYADAAEVLNLSSANEGKVTLYAQWDELPDVDISYEASAGGSVSSDSESVAPSSGTAEGSTATADMGQHLVSWTNDSDSRTSTDDVLVPSRNADGTYAPLTYTATFATNSYSVAFNANGGEGTMPQQDMTYGMQGVLGPNAFSWLGHTFLGWSTDASATAATYADGAIVSDLTTKDGDTVTLYAVWSEHPYVVVSYKAGDGGTVSPVAEKLYADSPAAVGSTATADAGYHFVAWVDASGATVSTDAAFVPAKTSDDWTEATYTATFEKDADAVTPESSGGTGTSGVVPLTADVTFPVGPLAILSFGLLGIAALLRRRVRG